MDIPAHVFREYDIRGLAGSELDEDFAYRLGMAFAALLDTPPDTPLVVGRDVRLSGPRLQRAAMRGLRDAGRDVCDIGIAPSPLAYYCVFQYRLAGCLHVTASHNPAAYNGFKMMRGRDSLHGAELTRLRALVAQAPASTHRRRGRYTQRDFSDAYIAHLAADCTLDRPLRVAIDAGNGPSGLIAARLYRRLGCQVVELYCEPDGRFPHHHPDPSVAENLRDLAACVRRERCDLGIAFDGDGDRIGVVDETGTVISPDMLLLVLARDLLRTHPGATIISEVKSSAQLYRGIREAGGKPLMWRTGHSPIKAKMRESGALLAGEMSGHIFFADRFFGVDDAVYAGARLMQVLAAQHAPLSSLLADIPRMCATPEIRLPCPEPLKFELVEQAITHFRAQGYAPITIDGMRLHLDEDCWGLLRASNTQDALVLRFEAPNPTRLAEVRRLIEDWLRPRLA